MEAVGLFLIYALTAAFLENMVFTRTLGVGRMVFSGHPRRILLHGAVLTAITFLSSLLSYWVNGLLYERQVSTAARALCYLLCITAVYAVFALVSLRLPQVRSLRRVLPVSAFNCAVLGALVLSVTTQNSLAATAGFGLGAGVGYTFALGLIYTGRQRLEMITLPRAFKGMPITLLYIGIVSLAIYGLIGHQLPT